MSNELTDEERARDCLKSWQYDEIEARLILERCFADVRADERQKCEAERAPMSDLDRKKIEFAETVADRGMVTLACQLLEEITAAMEPPTLAERARAILDTDLSDINVNELTDILREVAAQKVGE